MAEQNENKSAELDKNTLSTEADTEATADTPVSETPKKAQESKMTPDTSTPQQAKPHSQRPQSKNGLIYTTLLLSTGALALSGWQFYQSQLQTYDAKLDRISQTSAKLETILEGQSQAVAQISPMQNALTQVIPALKKLETDGQNTQENNAKLGAEITSVRKQLSRIKNTSKEDWKLAEAEYLVRLANQRLLMEKDINGAQKLLVSADTILADMKDPLLFDTRRALAKDIQALKSTRSFDLEGVYLQLEALVSQVTNLPQKEASHAFQTRENKVEEVTEAAPDTSYIKAVAQDIWQTLRSLVVITYNSKPIKPLLPPTEYQQLITGIQLQVNVAQLALLKQESSVYQIALEHIANAVNEHFDINSAAVSGYLTSLTALQQVNVSPELPLPRASLTSMKDLMENWNGKGKNIQQATQAPTETLGLGEEADVTAKPQAKDVSELLPAANASTSDTQGQMSEPTQADNASAQTSSDTNETAQTSSPLNQDNLLDDSPLEEGQLEESQPVVPILPTPEAVNSETQTQETSL